jgi:uncharacterized repeat protein (TIGR04076 family)
MPGSSGTAKAGETVGGTMDYRVVMRAKEVRGRCAMGYQPGDTIVVEKFYVKEAGKGVCLHALAAMLTLLAPLLKRRAGHSARNRERGGHGVRAVPRPRRTVHVRRNRGIRVEKGESGGRLELQPGSYDVHDPHRSPTVAGHIAEGGTCAQRTRADSFCLIAKRGRHHASLRVP